MLHTIVGLALWPLGFFKRKARYVAFSSAVEFWRERIEARANGVPTDFLLAWLTHESGGNPCATGMTGLASQGGAFEAGIGQSFYQPTSAIVHGVPLATLRAPCNGQRATRPLTDAEIQANVDTFIGDVQRFRAAARRQADAAQLDWSEATEDFWMLCKLQHGLPCIPKTLLGPAAEAGITTFLGFKSFVVTMPRAELDRLSASCSLKRFSQTRLGEIFDNAIKTGRAVGTPAGGALVAQLGGAVAPLAVLAVAYLMSRGAA